MPEPIKTSLSQPQPAGTGTSTSTSTLTNSSNGKRASANGQQPAASRYLPREVPPRFRQQEQKQLLKRGQPLPAGALSAPGPAPGTAAAGASPPPPPQQGAAGQQHPGKAQPGKSGAPVGLPPPLSRLFANSIFKFHFQISFSNSIFKFQSSSISRTCRFWHPLVKDFLLCSRARSCGVFLTTFFFPPFMFP